MALSDVKISTQKVQLSYEPFGKLPLEVKQACKEKVVLRKVNGVWLVEVTGLLSRIDLHRMTRQLRIGFGRYMRDYALRQRLTKKDEKETTAEVAEGTKIAVS